MSELLTSRDPTEAARRQFAQALLQSGLQGGPNDAGALGGLARLTQALTGAYLTKKSTEAEKTKTNAIAKAIGEASGVMTNPNLAQDNGITVDKSDFQGNFPAPDPNAAPTPGIPGQPDFKAAQVSFDQDKVNAMQPLDPAKRQAMAQAILAKNPDVAPLMAQQRLAAIFKAPEDVAVADGGALVRKNPDGTVTKLYENPKTQAPRAAQSIVLGKGGQTKTMDISSPAGKAQYDELTGQGWNEVRTPAASVTVSTSGPKAYDEEMGRIDAKAFDSLNTAGNAAPAAISKYQRLGSLLQGIKTGTGTATTVQLKAAAKAAGLDLDSWGIDDNVGPAQAADAMSKEMALSLRNPAGGAGMPGAMSDADRNYLESMVAGLGKDPGANAAIVDAAIKLKQRDADVARLARAYAKRNGGRFDNAGFGDELARWSAQNPLFPQATNSPGAGGAPGAQVDYNKMYGLTPKA